MASETPSLTGSSLYYPVTPFQLWLVKKGLASPPQHPGMRKGLEFEAFARAKFMEEYGVRECESCVVEEDSHLLAASLDGYYERAEGGQDVKTLAFLYLTHTEYPGRIQPSLATWTQRQRRVRVTLD
jgi:hypothetical protein